MHDAHYHFSAEIVSLQKEHHIDSLCNVANEQEWQTVQNQGLNCSVGIHPWSANRELFDSMMPLLEQSPIIGEIGMDSVWCENDLAIQRDIFIRQIEYAAKHSKPVILHTKGQEKEILDIIRNYPNTYFVHWYSSMDYVEDYNKVASFFSVGPSVGQDETVTELVKKIPIEKLLLESDGIDAIEWAIHSRDYLGALNHSIDVIAAIKGLSPTETEKILDANFKRLIHLA